MKRRTMKTLIASMLVILLGMSLAAPAYAAKNPYAAMEAGSRQAVEAAIKAGTVPAGMTIYDCVYGMNKNGVTIVIQYRDKNGDWIDVATKAKALDPPGVPANPKLTADELKAYADTMFELVNKEREKAGVPRLVRDKQLDKAAKIRAAEIKVVDHARGKPHTRPDGTSFKTVLDEAGITGKGFGENISRAKSTPQAAMKSLMSSTKGHRENILRGNYGSIGIGVYQRPDGAIDWIQIFELK